MVEGNCFERLCAKFWPLPGLFWANLLASSQTLLHFYRLYPSISSPSFATNFSFPPRHYINDSSNLHRYAFYRTQWAIFTKSPTSINATTDHYRLSISITAANVHSTLPRHHLATDRHHISSFTTSEDVLSAPGANTLQLTTNSLSLPSLQ